MTLAERAAALARANRHVEAIQAYEEALRFAPEQIEIHANLSASLAQSNRIEAAAIAAKRALALRPDMVALFSNLGRLEVRRGNIPAGLACFRRALQIQPRNASIPLALGSELALHVSMESAARIFRAAVVLEPGLAEAYANLVSCHSAATRWTTAIFCARATVALEPQSGNFHRALAWVLERDGDVELAARSALIAVILVPESAEAWSQQGTLALLTSGSSAAFVPVTRALRLSPAQPRYHRALSVLRTWYHEDDASNAMRKLLSDGPISNARDRAELHFALAKIEGDLGNASLRFDHLLRGNAAMRSCLLYDEAGTMAWFDTLRRVVTRDYISARYGGSKRENEPPIFIVGMPRSGTSLVEQILASHSKVCGKGESRVYSQLLASALRLSKQSAEQGLVALGQEEHAAIGRAYLAKMTPLPRDKSRFTDKMPANFAYIGLISLAVPGARIIHIERDPIDNCLSCFETLFAESQEYSYDLAELGRYYRAYRRMIEHWRATLPSDAFMTISYESLVTNFRPEIQRLLDYCGLVWEDDVMAFHKTNRIVRTASATQVRRALYKSSIGKARPSDHILAPLREALFA